MSGRMLASRIDATHQLTLPLTRLRVLLLRELAAQSTQASECRTTTNSLTGQTDVDSVLEREIAEASAARANDAVADVQHALERIDNGTYGACERCAAPMSLERLEVVPHARHCVDCSAQPSGVFR
jgi:RNA polymerase-binding transcription factor DksA